MTVWRAVIDPMRGPHLSVDGQVVANFYDPSVLPLVVAAPKLLERLKALIERTEATDNFYDMGVSSHDPVMLAAKAIVAEAEAK